MFLHVQGANIQLVDIGEGTSTLFLHGIPDSGDVWNDVTEQLKGSCRCLVPDLPGFGSSSVPAGFKVTLDGMANFVDALLVALNIDEPINLVVHDVGGPYGLAWAIRHPAKVRRIVVLNTVFQSEYRWHRYGRICRTPFLGELIQLLTSQSGLARELRAASGVKKPSRESIASIYSKFGRSTRRMVLQLYRGLDPHGFVELDDSLRRLASSIPSLVLWGDRDPYIASTFADRFGAQHVRHFPDCGHWPQLEIPEVVSAALVEFFGNTSH